MRSARYPVPAAAACKAPALRLSLDDELLSPDAYDLSHCWLERVGRHGVVPEVGQSWGSLAEGHFVVEQAGAEVMN
jgi:hypothetical protein